MHREVDSEVVVAVVVVVVVVVVVAVVADAGVVVAVVVGVDAGAALASFQCRPCSVGSWCWCRTGTYPAVDRPQLWDYAVPSTSPRS